VLQDFLGPNLTIGEAAGEGESGNESEGSDDA